MEISGLAGRPAILPLAAGGGPKPPYDAQGPAESVQLAGCPDLSPLLDPRMAPEHKAEALDFLQAFAPEELEQLRREGVVIAYEPLSPLYAGLYSPDASAILPVRKARVQINSQGGERRRVGIHEVAHALDRTELKAMVSKVARLFGFTNRHASETRPEFQALYQDYQARGTAQMAARLAAALDNPERKQRGYSKTEFPGVYYLYDYQPPSGDGPAVMSLRLYQNPHQKSRSLNDAEAGLSFAGGLGVVAGVAVAATISTVLGVALAGVAALPLALGLTRHFARRARFDQHNDFQRQLALPDGQSVIVTRQGENTRVELPLKLGQVPDWTWSTYALHSQEPCEYFAEGVMALRDSEQSRAELKHKDPALLDYLVSKPPRGGQERSRKPP